MVIDELLNDQLSNAVLKTDLFIGCLFSSDQQGTKSHQNNNTLFSVVIFAQNSTGFLLPDVATHISRSENNINAISEFLCNTLHHLEIAREQMQSCLHTKCQQTSKNTTLMKGIDLPYLLMTLVRCCSQICRHL